jgi:transcriptional regulator with XRE-family HTH domain
VSARRDGCGGAGLKPKRVSTFRPADVKALRDKLGTSQTEFALMIGVSVAIQRNWEQGRRSPEGPALALLRVPHVTVEDSEDRQGQVVRRRAAKRLRGIATRPQPWRVEARQRSR